MPRIGLLGIVLLISRYFAAIEAEVQITAIGHFQVVHNSNGDEVK